MHGTALTELTTLLDKLGWQLVRDSDGAPVTATHPAGRTAVFLGDLVDRIPDTPGVLHLRWAWSPTGWRSRSRESREQAARGTARAGCAAFAGVVESLEQLAAQPASSSRRPPVRMDELRAHYVLDDGELVVARQAARAVPRAGVQAGVRAFALYGGPPGATSSGCRCATVGDQVQGRGAGHANTPVPRRPKWINNTICLDTGCVRRNTDRAALPETRDRHRCGGQDLVRADRRSRPRTRRPPRRVPPTSWTSRTSSARHRTTGLHGRITIGRTRQPRWRSSAGTRYIRAGWCTCRRPWPRSASCPNILCRRSMRLPAPGWRRS